MTRRERRPQEMVTETRYSLPRAFEPNLNSIPAAYVNTAYINIHVANAGEGICDHGKRGAICPECDGKGLCAHGRERHKCKMCIDPNFVYRAKVSWTPEEDTILRAGRDQKV